MISRRKPQKSTCQRPDKMTASNYLIIEPNYLIIKCNTITVATARNGSPPALQRRAKQGGLPCWGLKVAGLAGWQRRGRRGWAGWQTRPKLGARERRGCLQGRGRRGWEPREDRGDSWRPPAAFAPDRGGNSEDGDSWRRLAERVRADPNARNPERLPRAPSHQRGRVRQPDQTRTPAAVPPCQACHAPSRIKGGGLSEARSKGRAGWRGGLAQPRLFLNFHSNFQFCITRLQHIE